MNIAIVPNLVTTIIPVYNRPEMIQEAVRSVIVQTYRPIEVVVVDDGSTDDTPALCESLARQYPEELHVIRKRNEGPGPAREMGRQYARGEFIQYLDSDDLLRPRKFALQVAALREYPECGAAYGYICFHPEVGPPRLAPYKGSGETRPTLFPWLLADRWWNTDAPLFRRSVCDAVGPWTDLRWSQDWEYDGRVGALGTKLVHCREFVCDQRQHFGERQTTPANWMEPFRVRERKRFLEMLFGHAVRARVGPEVPERKHFARWSFALARRCAAAGLVQEAREFFELAERAAGPERHVRKGFRLFRGVASVVGWRLAGKLVCSAEVLRPRAGSLTLPQSYKAVCE